MDLLLSFSDFAQFKEMMIFERAHFVATTPKIKSGKAVRVQLLAPVQMVVIIASPAGRVVNSSIPTQATPISANPTQTELPRSRNKTNKKMIMA